MTSLTYQNTPIPTRTPEGRKLVEEVIMSVEARAEPECRTCGGTGRIWSRRGWLADSGYTSTRCGICTGTGRSRFRDSPEYVRFQADCRAIVAKARGE